MQTVVPYFSTSLCKSKDFYEKFMNVFLKDCHAPPGLAMTMGVMHFFEIATPLQGSQ